MKTLLIGLFITKVIGFTNFLFSPSKISRKHAYKTHASNLPDESEEPMYSISYDPLEPPNQITFERDLEDFLIERAMRFHDVKGNKNREECFLVGLEDKSLGERNEESKFSMEESLIELSELAGAAGLEVVGSTFQRLAIPNIEYFIGPGIPSSLTSLTNAYLVFI